MNNDYYKILEVPKTATQEEIQKAYRKLARKHHPDMNQNDPKGAKEKFQRVQEAFDVLGNPEKRKIYDQFGVPPDQMGSGGGQGPFQWSFGGGSPGARGHSNQFNFDNLDDLIKMFSGGGFGNNQSPDDFVNVGAGRRPIRGSDVEQNLTIPFVMAVEGGKIDMKIRRSTGSNETVTVKIPAGIADGKKIRLNGLGNAGQFGGKTGNLLITVHIEEHPFFRRKDPHLYVKIPVTLKEAVFGAKIDIPAPKGNVTLTIPAGSGSDTKLRVRGCGIASKEGSGDLFAELSVVLPKKWTTAEKELLQKITSEPSEPVRNDLQWK
ncbi:MAG: DnaJ domain-containing protein [Planctomycetaceae bacterium]|jgi:molecular chaperone DnaJ/curved DNA-binding protein|nr:DnaJ domain-containing protein [Planctomycetaceae bacterium]